MSSYVSTNRLRTHIAGGIVGTAGTVTDAAGCVNVVHRLGTPTIFGAFIETSGNGVAQWSRQAKVRLSGPVIVVRIETAAAGASATATTAVFRWFAAE